MLSSFPPPTQAQIDVNSRALLNAIDSTFAMRLANAGENKKAVEEALKNLAENSPSDVANIALAGDILTAVGSSKEDKDLGFGLFTRAVSLAPNNQFLAFRYAKRMAAAGEIDQAAQQLSEIIQSHPQLNDVHLALAKILVVTR